MSYILVYVFQLLYLINSSFEKEEKRIENTKCKIKKDKGWKLLLQGYNKVNSNKGQLGSPRERFKGSYHPAWSEDKQ